MVLIIKKCRICGIEKQLSDFYSYQKVNSKGEDYIYHYPYCKECTAEKSYNYALSRPEETLDGKRKFRRSEKGKEHKRIHAQNARNSGEYKKWQQNNKDKIKKYQQFRQMHKSHNISDDELHKLYQYANNSCMYCGMTEEESLEKFSQRLHKDHAYNEGSDGIDNCVLACKGCNSSKRDQDWDGWYKSRDFYDESKFEKISYWLNNYKIIIE